MCRFKVKGNMGLSPYSNPSDAGILYVILVKTAMSISMMKAILRSMLRVFGIRVASWEEFSNQPVVVETFECCRGSPSKTYMDEFRNRTPTVRYDSVSCTMNQECSVCLVEFKPDAEINHLSCGHVFHTCCLEKWLKYWNITCPLCRNHMMGGNQVEENMCPM
ncbi:putative transcription factor C2H2 family [Helianthus annuus]|nr:putative transcription factor C2H2 family [Helianthus annuus]